MRNQLKNLGLMGLGVAVGVAVSLQYSALAQKMAGSPLPLDKLAEFSLVFDTIKSDYVVPVEDEQLLTDAMAGMVQALDPHSAYLDKKAFAALREETEGKKFVGLGVEVMMEDGHVKVVTPIEDTPAERAGILPGDIITRIDGQSIKGWTLDAAVKRMRGEPMSEVSLTIARKTQDSAVVIRLRRELIKQRSVKAKLIEPNYAWLRISQFQEPTVTDLSAKLQQLLSQNPQMKGLVLDLRNDPGGLLDGAVGVSAAFLPPGSMITSTDGQVEDAKRSFYARPEHYAARSALDPLAKIPPLAKKIPMVVLINAGTASASEIVAGALQDYQRATILGTTSFGKGSVQTIHQITHETGIKLTTARYYTPLGRAIQAKGIVPDLYVEEHADSDGINALRSREVDLIKHLKNDRALDDEDEDVTISHDEEQKLIAMAKKSKPVEYGSQRDFQLLQALNFLKGLPVKTSKSKIDQRSAQLGRPSSSQNRP